MPGIFAEQDSGSAAMMLDDTKKAAAVEERNFEREVWGPLLPKHKACVARKFRERRKQKKTDRSRRFETDLETNWGNIDAEIE